MRLVVAIVCSVCLAAFWVVLLWALAGPTVLAIPVAICVGFATFLVITTVTVAGNDCPTP